MTRAPIVVIGESVLDVVEAADGAREEAAGGSPANVAVGLARLGGSATLVTQLADDAAGRAIAAHVTAAGAALAADPSVRATSTAVAALDERGAASYTFDIEWSLDAAVVDGALDSADPAHVHVGSLATLLEPGAGAVRTAVERQAARGTVSYDPNIRPDLGPPADQARAAATWFVAHADVVKASDEDIALLYPGEDPLAVARGWLASRPSVVVVTRGDQGSVLLSAGLEHAVPVVTTTVADTVGAGDSFMAALVDGLDREGLLGDPAALGTAAPDRLVVVAERAARAAAITVSRRGAQPPSEVELA